MTTPSSKSQRKHPKYLGGLRSRVDGSSITTQSVSPGNIVSTLVVVASQTTSFNAFPILVRFIPSWFPGAGWKRQGFEWRTRLRYLSEVPHQWLRGQMVSRTFIIQYSSCTLRFPPDLTELRDPCGLLYIKAPGARGRSDCECRGGGCNQVGCRRIVCGSWRYGKLKSHSLPI